ncbi:protein PBDC1 [Ochotona curzoniae]|uniref:protein PBDC1 n=1 Tax=Ochotona curzoniae TaxID=130825 RepID=UPI001B347A00|nr:protein PBDC1 [Ochotona curzoniae]
MEGTSGADVPISGELVSVAHALSLPAESYGNDPDIEMAWAMRAMQHAEVYYKLISSVDPQFLKLTKVDDQIYSEFREIFDKLKIDVLDPEELKSELAKEKWRPFCLKFEGVVEDFNYGTLLRLDCSQGYTEENTIFAPRIQFLAIEIARNREGCNKAVYVGVQPKEGEQGVGGGEQKKAEKKEEEANDGGEKEQGAVAGDGEKEKGGAAGDGGKEGGETSGEGGKKGEPARDGEKEEGAAEEGGERETAKEREKEKEVNKEIKEDE